MEYTSTIKIICYWTWFSRFNVIRGHLLWSL